MQTCTDSLCPPPPFGVVDSRFQSPLMNAPKARATTPEVAAEGTVTVPPHKVS
ncbi:hypothetical protein ACFXGI_23705 [Streptomyces sp. NPDC059355]|uniref:hypothetical protein n=1 Tax=Streptomyces sp. NPDC059355 TaxID=3346811 RepID=UPI0036BA5DFE